MDTTAKQVLVDALNEALGLFSPPTTGADILGKATALSSLATNAKAYGCTAQPLKIVTRQSGPPSNLEYTELLAFMPDGSEVDQYGRPSPTGGPLGAVARVTLRSDSVADCHAQPNRPFDALANREVSFDGPIPDATLAALRAVLTRWITAAEALDAPAWLGWGKDFDSDVRQFLDEMRSWDAQCKVRGDATGSRMFGRPGLGRSIVESYHRRALELYRHWNDRLPSDPPMPSDEAIVQPDKGLAYLAALVAWARRAGELASHKPAASPAPADGAPQPNTHANGETAPAPARHSADYTSVHWYGTDYTFALGVQSSAVKTLWEEWKKTGLGLHQATIRNAVDPERDSFRVDKAFRNHPAFGTMIQNTGDGKYKLAPPADGKAPSAKKKREIRQNPAKARRKPR